MLKTFAFHDAEHRGTIRRVNYVTADSEGREVRKYANVYLPFGYDDSDEKKRYDILYLMHGGQGNPDSWLDSCTFKNMLDCSFQEKVCEPFIVVFPGYYNGPVGVVDFSHMERERTLVSDFSNETVKDVIPAV